MAPFSPLPPTYKTRLRPLPVHSFRSHRLWFSPSSSAPTPTSKVHQQYLSVDEHEPKSQSQSHRKLQNEEEEDEIPIPIAQESLKKSYSFLLFLFLLVIYYMITSPSSSSPSSASSSSYSLTSDFLEPLISYQHHPHPSSESATSMADGELTGWRRLRVGEVRNAQHGSYNYRRSKSGAVLDALSRIRKEHQDNLNLNLAQSQFQDSKLAASASADLQLRDTNSNFHKEQADKVEYPSAEETSASHTPPAPARREITTSSSTTSNVMPDTDPNAEAGAEAGNVSESAGDFSTVTGNDTVIVDQHATAAATASLSLLSVSEPTSTNYPSPDDGPVYPVRDQHRVPISKQDSQEDGGI